MEIPSSHAGVVKELKVKVGDKVSKGSARSRSLRGSRRRGGAGAPLPRAAAPPSAGAGAARRAARRQPARRRAPSGTCRRPRCRRTSRRAPTGALPHASPSIRKLARELGVRSTRSRAAGPRAASRRKTCRRFVKARDGRRSADAGAGAPRRRAGGGRRRHPGPAAVAAGRLREVRPDRDASDLSRIKKISGANLHRNWVMIPHVTQHDDADITELEAFRVALNKENEKAGVKVTMLAFLIKACVAALKKFPDFNASLDGEQTRPQAVLPHRLRRRHAERPGGAGDQGRRQEGRAADRAGDGRARRRRRATASSARPTCRAAASRSRRSAASAARSSRRSSTRPKSRSSACRKSRSKPVWDGKAFAAAPDAAAVALATTTA